MDKFEALEIKEEAARRKARGSLISFIEFVKPEYDTQWFHKVIAQKCEDILFGRSKKVMIFVPPQHGKEISNSIIVNCVDGYKKHGDLKIGDYVFGRNGQPVKVIALSEEVISEYDV